MSTAIGVIRVNQNGEIHFVGTLGSTISQRFIYGRVYNDANIISGTGFSVEEIDANHHQVIYDDSLTSDNFSVVVSPNNNNPVGVEGEYGVSTKSEDTDGFIVVMKGFDGTANDGGYNFIVIAGA